MIGVWVTLLLLAGDVRMEQVLRELGTAQREAGEAVQPPAPPASIESARAELRTAFGATLPPSYAALLARTNGVDFDGVVLYGAGQTQGKPGPGGFWQGLVEANRLWRDGPGHESYLVLGETDMDLVTVGLDGNDPVLRDKVSGDVNERFGSVEELVQRLLGSRL